MNKLNIIKELLCDIPILKPQYEEEILWIKDNDSLHVIFIMIFIPFLIESMNSNNENHLFQVFNFMEKMAASTDEDIQNVLVATVFEWIVTERDIIENIRIRMKSNTLKVFMEFEKACGY